MPYDLVIFDCDGVLVDSEPICNRILAEALRPLGLHLGYEETVRTFVGLSMRSCVELIEGRIGRPVPADFVAGYHTRLWEALAREVEVVTGIQEVLEALPIPCCVASSGDPGKMRITLGRAGLLPRFEGRMFSAMEVARGKPAPDLFLYAADRMGAAPGRCAVVEDTVPGVQAAVAAGMTVFGYGATVGEEALRAAGARTFSAMERLPALLGLRHADLPPAITHEPSAEESP